MIMAMLSMAAGWRLQANDEASGVGNASRPFMVDPSTQKLSANKVHAEMEDPKFQEQHLEDQWKRMEGGLPSLVQLHGLESAKANYTPWKALVAGGLLTMHASASRLPSVGPLAIPGSARHLREKASQWRPFSQMHPAVQPTLPPAQQAALQEMHSLKGWDLVLQKRGVSVWKRGHRSIDERASFAVRASIEIPTSAREVADILLTRDYDVIRRFNPTVVDGRDLEWHDEEGKERTTYVLTKPIWPLKARDFVCNMRHEILEGAELIHTSPATHARAPKPTKRIVRGKLTGLHLVESKTEDTCLYTCIHEIDPGGAAPRSLVN